MPKISLIRGIRSLDKLTMRRFLLYFVLTITFFVLQGTLFKAISFGNIAPNLLLILTVLWCVIPTVLHVEMQRNSLLWFIYLYAVIGYYRLHHRNSAHKGSTCIALAAVIIAAVYATAIVLDIIGRNNRFVSDHSMFFYGYDSIPIVIASLLLVIGFSRIKLKYNKFINTISAATFGVYLIHDNPYIRPLLWEKLFKNASYADSNMLILYSAGAVLAVFAACTTVELIRIHAVEKHCRRFYVFVAEKIDSMIEKVLFSKRFDDGNVSDRSSTGLNRRRPEGKTKESRN